MFGEFIPCPQELHETVDYGEDYNERHEAKEASNREKYGFSSWYDWNIAHYGTKWEVSPDFEVSIDAENPNTIILDFDTAWSPPIEFYETMNDMGWQIQAYYYEPGMAFCGLYEDGDNDEYSIEGNADWVVNHIPHAIDERFAISESMEMWDEEESEEDEIEDEDKSGPDAGC